MTAELYGDRAERCAGVFYGGNPAGSFKAAWVCVAVVIAWTGSTMTVLFGAMKVPITSGIERVLLLVIALIRARETSPGTG